jgi:hypothetical protein
MTDCRESSTTFQVNLLWCDKHMRAKVHCELARLQAIVDGEPPQDGTHPDTYLQPEHGWTCFHCGTTFRRYGPARLHFGPTPFTTPECLDPGAGA